MGATCPLLYRNRLKKKEWIAELQETNSQVRFLNRDLKSRMEKLEKELTQVQGVLVKIGVDRIPQVSEFIAMPSGPTESEMGQYDDEDEEEEEEETEMTEAPMIAPAATRA